MSVWGLYFIIYVISLVLSGMFTKHLFKIYNKKYPKRDELDNIALFIMFCPIYNTCIAALFLSKFLANGSFDKRFFAAMEKLADEIYQKEKSKY